LIIGQLYSVVIIILNSYKLVLHL